MNITIKNIIGYLATGIITAVVCLFILNYFFGPSFTLETYSVVDDEGFPGLNLSFNNRGTISVEIFDSSNLLVDSDTFFQGSHSVILHLDDYKLC